MVIATALQCSYLLRLIANQVLFQDVLRSTPKLSLTRLSITYIDGILKKQSVSTDTILQNPTLRILITQIKKLSESEKPRNIDVN